MYSGSKRNMGNREGYGNDITAFKLGKKLVNSMARRREARRASEHDVRDFLNPYDPPLIRSAHMTLHFGVRLTP